MGVGKQILYLKAEQNVEVKTRNVTLGEVFKMECTEKSLVPHLKTIKLLKIPQQGDSRVVLSILSAIALIHKEYPALEIQNLGETDIIVTYEPEKKKNKFIEYMEILGVTALSFIGAAFAIMTFHNDSGTTKLLGQIYELAMGEPSTGHTILELTYSIGLAIGIIVFFNHFGRKKLSVDPTPIEVEMRLYEKDIQTTLIEDYSRKGQELDVDKSDSSGNHRT